MLQGQGEGAIGRAGPKWQRQGVSGRSGVQKSHRQGANGRGQETVATAGGQRQWQWQGTRGSGNGRGPEAVAIAGVAEAVAMAGG
jgi:hypothetical protein